jgi:hypothetical protein
MVLQGIYLPTEPEECRRHTTEALDGASKFRSADDVVAYVESLPDPDSLEREFDFEARLQSVQDDYLKLQEELGNNILCLPTCNIARFTWYKDFGYESYLTAMALYPDAMKRLFRYSAEEPRLLNMVLVELVKQGQLPPFLFTGQDICGNQGLMVSPGILRSIFFPAVQRQPV